MSIMLETKRCSVFDEFTSEQKETHFSLVERKVIHNIDTLYYSVFLSEIEDKFKIAHMVETFTQMKESLNQDRNKEIVVSDLTLLQRGFSIYKFCFELENMYHIFISDYLPNPTTPRIVVQLRSIGLWIDGTEELIQKSFNHLKAFMSLYGVNITIVRENRIDYCYHINSIQNPQKYFSDESIEEKITTVFTMGSKVFRLGRKKKDATGVIKKKLTTNYLSLGQLKSNNVFFRAYDKTREVIEKNYKSFFIEYWHQTKLISNFDKYCLEHAYKKGSYNALLEGRCLWYLEHGSDAELKTELEQLLKICVHNSDNFLHLESAIDGVIPKVTIITNIEFQTKRKFYYSFDESIKNWKSSLDPKPTAPHDPVAIFNPLRRLFSIVQNRKTILDYLTTKVVFFDGAWWERIISCKIKHDYTSELIREYTTNLDRQKVKRNFLKSVATLSIYDKSSDTYDFNEDFENLVATLNDNDMYNYSKKPIFIDGETGEQLELHDKDYEVLKKKKTKQLKSII